MFALEPGEPFHDPLPGGDHVAALDGGHPETDGGLPVEEQQIARRVEVAAPDLGHISQPDHGVRTAAPNEHIAHLVETVEGARGRDPNVLLVDADATIRDHRTLVGEGTEGLVRVEPELGHLGP